MPRFKSTNFYQNRPEIKTFAKKCKVFKRLGFRPRTPETATPHCGILATLWTVGMQFEDFATAEWC